MEVRFAPLVILLVLAVALVLGALAGPWVHRRLSNNPDGDTTRNFGYIVVPAVTLTTLLLSFTLVTVWSSYQTALERTRQEALTVDHLADMAELVNDPLGESILASTVCYSRAIAGPEWETMSTGGTMAPEAEEWTDRLEYDTGELSAGKAGQTSIGREILTTDRDRGVFRGQRLAEAEVSVPTLVMVMLIGFAALAIIALAVSLVPPTDRLVPLVGLAVVGLMFAAALSMISELDSPFYGLVDIDATSMRRVADNEGASFGQRFPTATLPCDDQGRVLTP